MMDENTNKAQEKYQVYRVYVSKKEEDKFLRVVENFEHSVELVRNGIHKPHCIYDVVMDGNDKLAVSMCIENVYT